jgi:hypothetical protein
MLDLAEVDPDARVTIQLEDTRADQLVRIGKAPGIFWCGRSEQCSVT